MGNKQSVGHFGDMKKEAAWHSYLNSFYMLNIGNSQSQTISMMYQAYRQYNHQSMRIKEYISYAQRLNFLLICMHPFPPSWTLGVV